MSPVTSPDVATHRAGWLPSFCLLSVIWGSSFLFIKVGVGELHPLYLTLGRVATGAVAVSAVLIISGDRLPRDWRLWGHLGLIGSVAVALPFTLFGYGEQRTSSILAGIWNATTPLVALPLGALVFRTDRMTARRAAGVVLGFLGVLVVLGVWRGVGGADLTGQLMCLAAAACYGFSTPYQQKFIAGRAESGLALTATQLLLATGVLAVVAPLVAGPPPDPTGLAPEVIASVLTLGGVGTGLAFVLLFRVIRRAGATTASMVTYVLPFVAVLIGAVVLDEGLAWHQPLGGLVVLAGVALSKPGTQTGGPSQGRAARHRRESGQPVAPLVLEAAPAPAAPLAEEVGPAPAAPTPSSSVAPASSSPVAVEPPEPVSFFEPVVRAR